MGHNAEKKVEKEFALVNNIIERHWNRAIGLANAESLMTYWTVGAFVSARLRQAQWGGKDGRGALRLPKDAQSKTAWIW